MVCENSESGSSAVLPQSWDEAETQLIDCVDLWRRSPGGGAWPFAGDGPWHLIQGEDGDYAGEGVDGAADERAPRTPLDAGEVGLRDTMTAWLGRIDDVMVRKAVWLGVVALHRGEGRVPWKAVAGWVGWDRSTNALAGRYRLALAQIVCGVNGWPMRRARPLAMVARAEVMEEVA